MPFVIDAESTRAAKRAARPTARAAAAAPAAVSSAPVRTGVRVETQIRGSRGTAVAGRRSITRPRARHEPAVGAAAQDRGGPLRDDRDAQRVREGPVVARAHHRRERVHPRQHRRAVEPDERPSDERRKRRADLPGDLRRAAAHLDPVDREERRLAREQVPAERDGEQAEADCERAAGRGEAGKPRPWMHLRQAQPRGQRRSLHARDGPSETSPGRHVPVFVAGPDLPTARAARARRETRPRAGARRRTARARDGAPRP